MAHGVAVHAAELVVLSPAGFVLCTGEPGFRRFVFGLFADRLGHLMALA